MTVGGGDDTVTNTSSVSMVADGDAGNDTLIGGPGPTALPDGFGSDVPRGNDGPDFLGTALSNDTGTGDLLGDVANDGTQVKGDNVASHTHSGIGSRGPDILLGNAGDHPLMGEDGPELRGDDGNDTLAGGDLFAVPFGDGRTAAPAPAGSTRRSPTS